MISLIVLMSLLLTIQGIEVIPIAPILTIAAQSNSAPFQYIVIVIMENTGIGSIIGNPSAPYLNSLANSYSLATNDTAVDHPSLPNYLDLTSATNSGITTDCDPTACPVTATNVVDRIESASLTWKAWAEDYPVSQGCSLSSGNAAYAPRHFPFVYYQDIANNPNRCNNLYDANSVVSSSPENDDLFLKALGSTSTAANYMWLTPNLCDDVHDCSISTGDSYLSQLVPAILNSYIFATQKAALFITFDEGDSNYPSDYVYTLWAGPSVKSDYKSSLPYSHFSLLKTIEDAWGLQSLTTYDGSAADMSQFLTGNGGSTNQTASTGPCTFCLNFATTIAPIGIAVVALTMITVSRNRKLSRQDQTSSSDSEDDWESGLEDE